MGIRRKARILALHALYQSELTATPVIEKFPLLCENFEVNKKSIPYAQQLLNGISQHWDEINQLIQENAANWRLSRMSVIDRNIMRIATYEMRFQEDVPAGVVIDEAIEVAKLYSTDEAAPFINGVLDSINKSLGKRR